MFPTIHNWAGDDLTTQGYGALADCLSCEVTEELNGAYTLEMTYPLNGLHAEYIEVGNIIVAKPNHNQERQAFRINEIKRSFSNNIQIYANHISYDMSGYYVRGSYSFSSLEDMIATLDGWDWSGESPYYHQFSFGTDMSSSQSITMPPLQTLRSYMGGQEGSILDVYGGEWIYDNFNCFLTSRRGKDTGYRISYGKNLASYEKQKTYNSYSAICAYWKKSDAVVSGNIVPTGWSVPFRVGYFDASNQYETQPTRAQLDASATAYIATINPLPETITITPTQIGNDVIGLGDSILICYETVFQTRVIKTVWDVLGGSYTNLVLGTKSATIVDAIKSLVK